MHKPCWSREIFSTRFGGWLFLSKAFWFLIYERGGLSGCCQGSSKHLNACALIPDSRLQPLTQRATLSASFRKITVIAVWIDCIFAGPFISDAFRFFFGKLMEYLQFGLPAAALLGCCRRFDASTTSMSLTQANSSVESFRLVKSHARPEGTQEWNQDRMLLGTFFFTGEKKHEKTFRDRDVLRCRLLSFV